MTKEVMNQENNEVVSFEEYSDMDTGFEGTDATTFKTPFMLILQALSPELKKSDPKYLPNAETGMFCNTATQELHTELSVVVLKIEHSLIGWRPNRGGFVGRYTKDMESRVVHNQEGLKKWDKDGNEIVDHIEFWCMNAKNPSDIFILSLSKALMKHAKSLASRIRFLTQDGKAVKVTWAGVWNIRLVEESNDKGSWYTIGNTPDFVRWVTKDEVENYIKPAKEMLKTAETDYSTIESASAEEAETMERF